MIRQRLLSFIFIGSFVASLLQFAYLVSADLLQAAPSLRRGESSGYVLSDGAVTSDATLPGYVSYQPIGDSNHAYYWKAVESPEAAYQAVLAQELNKYPSKFIQKIGLKKIYVVDELASFDDVAALGFTDTLSSTIYLRQTDENRAYTELIRSTIHHEIGHLAMVALRGMDSLYDNQWQGIVDYIYGSQQANSSYFPADGFVSDYAMSSVAEDMAEVFAFGMSSELADDLAQHANTDELLKAKVEIIDGEISQTSLQWPAVE